MTRKLDILLFLALTLYGLVIMLSYATFHPNMTIIIFKYVALIVAY